MSYILRIDFFDLLLTSSFPIGLCGGQGKIYLIFSVFTITDVCKPIIYRILCKLITKKAHFLARETQLIPVVFTQHMGSSSCGMMSHVGHSWCAKNLLCPNKLLKLRHKNHLVSLRDQNYFVRFRKKT